MANYATDADLELIITDIFEHGISTFEYELGESTLDIQRKLKGEWWLSLDRDPADFNPALLVDAEWKRACVYHSLAFYILPKLANFSDNDTFINMMEYYKMRFTEEFNAVILAGVSYDFNEDNIIDSDETDRRVTTRLYR